MSPRNATTGIFERVFRTPIEFGDLLRCQFFVLTLTEDLLSNFPPFTGRQAAKLLDNFGRAHAAKLSHCDRSAKFRLLRILLTLPARMIPREILKKIRQIELRTNRLVNETLGGQYHSVFKGQGMNFEEVREYQPGDEVRTIDWNVTARMNHPFVKKFVEERELTLMLVVDLSGSGLFGSGEQSKRELAAEIASVLAFSAIRNNDKVGLILFTDEVEKYMPPKKGRRHVLRVIREILFFEPQRRGTNLSGALDFLNRVTAHRAITVVISDFLEPGGRRTRRSIHCCASQPGTFEQRAPQTGLNARLGLAPGQPTARRRGGADCGSTRTGSSAARKIDFAGRGNR